MAWKSKLEKTGTDCQWTPEESHQLLALPFLAGSLPVASRYLLMISSWVLAEQGWYLEYSMVYSPFPCRVGKRKRGWAMCNPAGHTAPVCEGIPGILHNPTQTNPQYRRIVWPGIPQLCSDLIPCCSCQGQDDPMSPNLKNQTYFSKNHQEDLPLCKTSALWHIQTYHSVAPKIQTYLLKMRFFPSLLGYQLINPNYDVKSQCCL